MATPIWKFQNGTTDTDEVLDVEDALNNTFVLVGRSSGDWDGANAGSADMAAMKLDIDGNLLWKWQDGTAEEDSARAVAVAGDGTIVIGGDRTSSGAFVAVKLDTDGTFMWQREYQTGEAGGLNTLAIWEDGSMVFAGYTKGDWNGTHLGDGDFAAWKLSADGALQWKWQGGTNKTDFFTCSAVGENGSVVLAGASEGNWDGINFGSLDFSVVKLDSDGREIWRWQSGVTGPDIVNDVAIGNDGSVFLAGDTCGDWNGTNAGRSDFAAAKLDADGNEVWRWQSGTTGYDRWHGILAEADGSVILAGVSWGSWGDSYAGDGDFAALKLDENGTEVWRWQDGTPTFDKGSAIASSGSNSQVLVAGASNGVWDADNLAVLDFAAVLLDTDIPGNAAPTSTPFETQTSDPAVSPSLSPASFDGATQSPGETTEGMPTLTPSADTRSSGPTSVPTLLVDPTTFSPLLPNPTSSPTVTAGPTPLSSPVPAPTSSPTLAAGDGTRSNTTTMVAVLSSLGFLIVMTGAGWLYRRRSLHQEDVASLPTIQDGGNDGDGSHSTLHGAPPPSVGLQSGQINSLRHEIGLPSLHIQQKTGTEATSLASFGAIPRVPDVGQGEAVDPSLQRNDAGRQVAGDVGNQGKDERYPSSNAAATMGGAELWSADHGKTGTASPEAGASGNAPINDFQKEVRGIGLGFAVMGTAQELVQMSHLPGVTEAAGLVVVLMNLVTDSSDLTGAAENMIKRCRSVTMLLQRAASVLEEVDNSNEAAHRLLIEDVHDAVADLVDIIKAYQSKGRISQVMMSTLFKRRQEEAEAVIEAAMCRLNLGLHIQVGHKLNKLGQDLGGLHLQLQGSEPQRSEPGPAATSLLEARRMRRQRNLDKVEIPEDDVTVTDELLGKGGFGAVYIANYNGRNAAAKVVRIDHDLGRLKRGQETTVCGITQLETNMDHDSSRRKAFWRELEAMIRLRSPHIVHVYGAITSREDRLVLVMELLTGGDLRALLKDAVEPLAEARARRIIGDMCTGMSFLHSKETIHGDLKSPNVLLDGTGRAKIGDFGTSKWPRHANSTGLAAYTTRADHITKMSYAWAAPEVLDAKSTSYASDVYSFGVVVWEVLSRKLPWEDECLRNTFVRVVIKEQRPKIPADSPGDLVEIINACWESVPSNRPSFNDITQSIGWG